MMGIDLWAVRGRHLSATLVALMIAVCVWVAPTPSIAGEEPAAPLPLLAEGEPVDWWFVFKFNTASFPGCGDGVERSCLFGGEVQEYKYGFSQQYVYASSADPTLKKGDAGCAGGTDGDPVGATFGNIYDGEFYYVVWNDQFYKDPKIKGCGDSCGAPWGHSKGMVAWNEDGEGMVMQVTTPSWPGAADRDQPRQSDGNTLGCVLDNNVKVSQHFFALRLSADDLEKVLKGLANASVTTDVNNPQIVRNGGPANIQALVDELGVRVKSTEYTHETLSTGVQLITKPSKLNVPPWQMVSSLLGGPDLRVATWWATPKIPSTTDDDAVGCWSDELAKPGGVVNAEAGSWDGVEFGLKGGGGKNFNHAKIGISVPEGGEGDNHYSIFGDMNQQGALADGVPEGRKCTSSQNGRGGTFYVIDNAELNQAVGALIGETN